MMLRNFFTITLAASILLTMPAQKTYAAHNPQRLVLMGIGGATALGGVYMICREKQGIVSKVLSPVVGFSIFIAGCAIVLASDPEGSKQLTESLVKILYRQG